jgi:hypothetical protein
MKELANLQVITAFSDERQTAFGTAWVHVEICIAAEELFAIAFK